MAPLQKSEGKGLHPKVTAGRVSSKLVPSAEDSSLPPGPRCTFAVGHGKCPALTRGPMASRQEWEGQRCNPQTAAGNGPLKSVPSVEDSSLPPGPRWTFAVGHGKCLPQIQEQEEYLAYRLEKLVLDNRLKSNGNSLQGQGMKTLPTSDKLDSQESLVTSTSNTRMSSSVILNSQVEICQ